MKKITVLLLVVVSLKGFAKQYPVYLTTDLHTPPAGPGLPYTYLATEGELRDAIYKANLNPGLDTIVFNFPANSSFPISINLVPCAIRITDAVVIDGNSQSGVYAGNESKIKIIGAETGSTTGGGSGIYVTTSLGFWIDDISVSGTKIENLTFTNQPVVSGPFITYGAGVWISSSSNVLIKNCVFKDLQKGILIGGDSHLNQIKSNYFGTDKSLTVANNDMTIGILFSAGTKSGITYYPDNNTVGGGNAIDKNYFYNIKLNSPSYAIQVDQGKKNRILNNIFIDNQKNIHLSYSTCNPVSAGASNNCKAVPTITSALIVGTTAIISGTTGAVTDKIEIYKTNVSNNKDAIKLVGNVTTASTSWTLTVVNSGLTGADKIIATATDKNFNTSEFTVQPTPLVVSCFTCPANNITITPPLAAICKGQSVEFTGAVTSGCNANDRTLWRWNYGDGTGQFTSNKHTFNSVGKYTVKYFIPASATCPEISKTLLVSVIDCPVTVGCAACSQFDFYFPNKICVGEKVVFEKLLVGCRGNSTVVWDFGDGTPPTSNPEHTYIANGSPTVTMSIPDVCARSKPITVVTCPEFSCDPVAIPCASLGLDATVSLESSPASNPTTGTYYYKVTPSVSPTYTGSFTYLWGISFGATIQGSPSGNIVQILKPLTSTPLTLTVTVTTTDGSNCFITKTFNPCADYSAAITQQNFSIPTATYKVTPTAPVPPIAATYSYVWSVSSTPVGASGSSTTNTLNVTNIPANDPALALTCLITETANGSNGCAVNVSQNFQPCSSFLPNFSVTGGNGSVTCTATGYTGPDTDYIFTWQVTTAAGTLFSGQGTKEVVVNYTVGETVSLKLTMEQKNGAKCKKETVKTVALGG